MIRKGLLQLTIILCSFATISLAAAESIYSVPLKWKNDDGQATTLDVFRGKLVVLTLAYTRCKSACPLTLGRLRKMRQVVDSRGKEIEIVIVSLEPDIDSASALKAFRQNQKLDDPHWHFLTGSSSDLRKLAVLLGMSYQKDPKSDEIMHSNKLVVLNKNGEIFDSLDGLSSDVVAFAEKITQ